MPDSATNCAPPFQLTSMPMGQRTKKRIGRHQNPRIQYIRYTRTKVDLQDKKMGAYCAVVTGTSTYCTARANSSVVEADAHRAQ